LVFLKTLEANRRILSKLEESISSVGGAKKAYKRAMDKVHVLGRDRVVYLGVRNKKYIKLKGKYVALSDARKIK